MNFGPLVYVMLYTKLVLRPSLIDLKPYLNAVISHTQSAFVSGRLITDNVLVAYEVNHFIHCHTQGNRVFMALKLDVNKAYDRIE